MTSVETSDRLWDRLPVPVLAHALQWIPSLEVVSSVSDVSRSWRQACEYPLVWRCRSEKETFMYPRDHFPAIAIESMSDMIRIAPHVKNFALNGSKVSDAQLTRFLPRMQRMTSLQISGAGKFTSKGLEALPSTVTSLTWWANPDGVFTNQDLEVSASRCLNLKSFTLRIAGTGSIENEKLKFESGLKAICSLPLLTQLTLSGPYVPASVMKCISSSQTLECIHLNLCEELTSEGIELLCNSPSLRALRINCKDSFKWQLLFQKLSRKVADLILSEDSADMLSDAQLDAFFGEDNQLASKNELEVIRVGGFCSLSDNGMLRLFQQLLHLPRLKAIALPHWVQPPQFVKPIEQVLIAEGLVPTEMDYVLGSLKANYVREPHWLAPALPVSRQVLLKLLDVVKEVNGSQ